jgi:hypothetical protein
VKARNGQLKCRIGQSETSCHESPSKRGSLPCLRPAKQGADDQDEKPGKPTHRAPKQSAIESERRSASAGSARLQTFEIQLLPSHLAIRTMADRTPDHQRLSLIVAERVTMKLSLGERRRLP